MAIKLIKFTLFDNPRIWKLSVSKRWMEISDEVNNPNCLIFLSSRVCFIKYLHSNFMLTMTITAFLCVRIYMCSWSVNT